MINLWSIVQYAFNWWSQISPNSCDILWKCLRSSYCQRMFQHRYSQSYIPIWKIAKLLRSDWISQYCLTGENHWDTLSKSHLSWTQVGIIFTEEFVSNSWEIVLKTSAIWSPHILTFISAYICTIYVFYCESLFKHDEKKEKSQHWCKIK